MPPLLRGGGGHRAVGEIFLKYSVNSPAGPQLPVPLKGAAFITYAILYLFEIAVNYISVCTCIT